MNASCFAVVALSVGVAANATDISVTVQNITPNKGHMAYALFNSDNGFPSKKDQAFKRGFLEIPKNNAEMTFLVSDLPDGEYAMLVYQDINDNLVLDKNFIGIPREPAGASNNPPGRLGPPRYRDCKFKTSTTNHKLTIKLVN